MTAPSSQGKGRKSLKGDEGINIGRNTQKYNTKNRLKCDETIQYNILQYSRVKEKKYKYMYIYFIIAILYNILIRKSRSDSSLDLVISDLLCERSLKL